LAPATWWGWALAFGLFRLFDIVKPWPVDRLEKLQPVGLGIMADDLMAGVMAAIPIASIGLWVSL